MFDNSDGRLTVEMDEVVLRRTIGLKKDEFFLNRKRVTKSEVGLWASGLDCWVVRLIAHQPTHVYVVSGSNLLV